MTTMTSRLFSALAGAALLMVATGQGEAGTIYSAPPDYGRFAFHSTSVQVTGNQQQLSPFQVTTDSTAIGLDWWGIYLPGPATDDTYTIGLYTGTSTGPNGTPIVTTTVTPTRTDTGRTDGFYQEVYKYSATLASPISLTGGTPYYISILNNENAHWSWQFAGTGTDYYRYIGSGPAWLGVGTQYGSPAFDLTAAPEPSTLVLGGIAGLVGLGCAWNRRRRLETRS